jgi:DNA-binding CsgD family transcriptional regulator
VIRNPQLAPRDRKMLELLAKGMPNAAIARKLGYKHGSTRVYLHHLYRKLGVKGKTAAVVWYFDHLGAKPPEQSRAAPADNMVVEDSLGEMALRGNLYGALGAMALFLGPYGKVWQVASRLKGGAEPVADDRSRRTRSLWIALLKGDFGYAARFADAVRTLDSPADAVLLALLLYFGGQAAAANRVRAQLARMKRVPARDLNLVDAARDVVEAHDSEGLERIHRIATESAEQTPARHVAIAALYYAYRTAGDLERASGTAEALWAEADVARRHLSAMGERAFAQNASPPRPAGARQAAPRHKEAVTTR